MKLDLFIEKFGGAAQLAKVVGSKHTSIVSNWKKRGNIPFEAVPLLLKHAEKNGITITLEQLVKLAQVAK